MSAQPEPSDPSDVETCALGPPGHHADSTVDSGGVQDSAVETVVTGHGSSSGGPNPILWRVGQYEVKGELARGGMGIVYRATHVGLGRELALKVLRLDRIGGAREVERFQLEARAAARLVHPNIVSVHDVGECAAGPYLVMDLVEGDTLATVIRRDGPLVPRAAAAIVQKLADALACAHAQAILHRDVKPANVIIARSGEPMLADFGLAKDLHTEERLTETGSVVGTPAYMPPEQARGDTSSVDRRSDVYSLGATLYEALTGRPPFDGATPMATLRRVLSEDPVLPSRLRPGLDHDLETICLKCLEKEPHLRYGSAAALADDLRRFLANESILAARPSLVGRGRKWVRRNPALTRALVTFTVGGLTLAAIGTGVFVQRLQRERDVSARQAEIARDTIDVLVYQVRDGLRDVPGARVREVRHELLERALHGLERLRAEDRTGRVSLRSAEVHRQVGEIALVLGQTAAAGDALARSIETLRTVIAGGGDDAARAQALLPDVLVDAGRAHLARGDLSAAQARVEEALALRRTPAALTALADVLVARGELESARQALDEALELRRAAVAQDPASRLELAAALVTVGSLARRQGALATAVQRYDEALLITGELLRQDARSAPLRRAHADHLVGAGDARTDQGDHAAARERYEQALAAYRALVAEDPESVPLVIGLVDALQRLGDTAARANDPAGALGHYDEALTACRQLEARDPGDERALERLRGLLTRSGDQRRERGDLSGARAALEEALTRLHARLLAAPQDATARESFALTQARLAQLLSSQGDDLAAVGKLERAASALRTLLAEEPSNAQVRSELLVTIGHRGELLEDLGDLEGARRCYDETLDIGAELLTRDPSNARARANQTGGLIRVGLLLHRVGEIAEALEYVRRAIDNQRPLAARDPQYADTLRWLEETVLVQFTTSLALAEGQKRPTTPLEHADLGRTLLRRRRYAEASDAFAVALADDRFGQDLFEQHLLNAARAAACASAAGGERASEHRRRAITWLTADVIARRARVAALDRALESLDDETSRTPRRTERRRHQRMIESMRRDPDLRWLSGPDGLDAVLGPGR